MELQLGLALALPLPTSTTNDENNNPLLLDLNSRAYYHPKPHLSNNSSSSSSSSSFNKKRSFSQLILFVDDHAADVNNMDSREVVTLPPTTLPLLPLTPNHDDDDHHHHDTKQHHHAATNCSTTVITKSDENNDDDDVELGPVGWPPVNFYWRKRLRYADNYTSEDDHHEVAPGNIIDQNQTVWIDPHHHGSVGSSRGSNTHTTLYVKVKMEGVGIARKVDLSLHHSFDTLKDTLLYMFGKCNQFSKSYELAYQDEEGDWLLAEDVPWRSFIQCAQRLKLLKSSSG